MLWKTQICLWNTQKDNFVPEMKIGTQIGRFPRCPSPCTHERRAVQGEYGPACNAWRMGKEVGMTLIQYTCVGTYVLVKPYPTNVSTFRCFFETLYIQFHFLTTWRGSKTFPFRGGWCNMVRYHCVLLIYVWLSIQTDTQAEQTNGRTDNLET